MKDICMQKVLKGRILDIGGGGEGVIGRVYGSAVTVIDIRREELDEAPDTCDKRVMDACCMTFTDDCFDHATSFFTLMYLHEDDRPRALAEAHRVLRPGGTLHIWDARIESACPTPFEISLDIDADGSPIHTTYGVLGEGAALDMRAAQRLCRAEGFVITSAEDHGTWFSLEAVAEKSS